MNRNWKRQAGVGLLGALGLACGLPQSAVGGTDDAAPGDAERVTPVVRAYQRVRDSIVNIGATQTVEVRGLAWNIFGGLIEVPREHSKRSVGSGFVIHADGYIATNAHVVAQGAELNVTFADGRMYDARVVARDNVRDLAVIKIDPDEPLSPIVLGRSDDLMIGETTIAVGNPVGLHNTLTTGVISALHRQMEIGSGLVYRDLVQTDASINPGNSGGPLLNIRGELIGINTVIRTDAQNIGFAIPVDQLQALLPELLDSETVNRVQVGMAVAGRDPIRVVEIRSGSPADRAGVQLGDVIQALDGRPLTGTVDYLVSMLARRADDVVRLRLLRRGRVIDAKMRLQPVPKPDGGQLALDLFGLDVEEMTARKAKRIGLSVKHGLVVVIGVERRSPADRADIRPGDLLVYIGKYRTTNLDEVGAVLANVRPDDGVDLGVWRKGRRYLVEINKRVYAR